MFKFYFKNLLKTEWKNKEFIISFLVSTFSFAFLHFVTPYFLNEDDGFGNLLLFLAFSFILIVCVLCFFYSLFVLFNYFLKFLSFNKNKPFEFNEISFEDYYVELNHKENLNKKISRFIETLPTESKYIKDLMMIYKEESGNIFDINNNINIQEKVKLLGYLIDNKHFKNLLNELKKNYFYDKHGIQSFLLKNDELLLKTIVENQYYFLLSDETLDYFKKLNIENKNNKEFFENIAFYFLTLETINGFYLKKC